MPNPRNIDRTSTVAFETTELLGADETYTSPVVILTREEQSQVQTEILSGPGDGTMVFTFYGDDAGTDVIRTLTVPYAASDGYRLFSAPTFGRAVRYSFTNGSTPQTDFYFTTKILRTAISPQLLAVNAFVSPSMVASVSRSVLVGADSRGNYGNVQIDDDASLQVSITSPTEAFGAVLVSDLHPYVQRKWVAGLNTQQDETVGHDGGTVSASTGELVLNTSGTTSSAAIYRSRKIVGHRPGQAVVARFTMRFTSGTAGTEQLIGIGGAEDGLFFGFNGAAFGVLRRTSGQVEIRTLTVTAAATGAGNVTITLNGGAVVVAMDGTESIAEAAANIAAADYSTAGGGWIVYYQGNQVVWLAIDTATRSGSYSFADTGGTGVTATGPAQTIAASAATDNWTAQTAWNLDPADGTETLPVLDPTSGNVASISYQWLGYGAVIFALENPVSGRFVGVHRIQYANANTAPTLRQPDLPLYASANNGATTDDITLTSASMGGFVAGELGASVEVRYSSDNSKSTDTTRLNVITLRVPLVFGGRTNRKRVRLDSLALGNNSSNRTSQFHVTLNPQLVGAPSWASVDATNSVVEYDTATTDIVSGTGRRVGTYTIGAVAGEDIHLEAHNEVVLEPGDILVVSAALASGGTSATQVAALGWSETV